jgi:hypothetical protein
MNIFRSSCALTWIVVTAVAGAAPLPPPSAIDTKKAMVVLPFESEVKGAPGFTESARTTVVAFLKDDGTFAAVLDPAEAKGRDKAGYLEMSAKLVEFKGGNMATRMMVGLGSGRASATLDVAIRDPQSGSVVWQKRIKEKASVWSNSASSAAQRGELPEKIAKTLLRELKGGAK